MDITMPVSISPQGATNIWNAIRKRVCVYRNSDEVYPAITKLVTSAKQKHPLLVSIGEGDFVQSWLSRICEEHQSHVQISRLVLARIRTDLAEVLEEQGLLRSEFRSSMLANIEALRADPGVQRADIQVEVRTWSGLPPFHGWLFGDRMLIGRWSVNDAGELHVKTPVFDTDTRSDPAGHTFARDAFPSQ